MDSDVGVRFGMQTQQRSLIHEKQPMVALGPGLWLDRIQPGGKDGPGGEVLSDFPGGRVWTDSWLLGAQEADRQMLVPDIRLPANQYWPLHWHDCAIAVVVLDGTCLVGDWWMAKGDVLISAAGVEYGPLVIGPKGCQMFEVFADLATHAGGYSPEYRDHPTLLGGMHAFKERSALNKRNDNRMCLPVDGVEGLVKGKLANGASWDLGEPDDMSRGYIDFTELKPGDSISRYKAGDWTALFLLNGDAAIGDRPLDCGAVIVAECGAEIPAMEAGSQGCGIFRAARTIAGAPGRA